MKNHLSESGFSLSGGQQQRLCIARAIAIQPEVLLLDEPCSSIDPISSTKIEKKIEELKTDHTIVIVMHNLQQATRVSDFAGFMYLGPGRVRYRAPYVRDAKRPAHAALHDGPFWLGPIPRQK